MRYAFAIWSLFFACICSTCALAQPICALQKQQLAAKGTVASPREDDYDVQYVKFDLDVTDTAAIMSGSVITVMRVTAATMDQYVFELIASKTVDSVKINGVSKGVQSIGADVYAVPLPGVAAQNSILTAQVFYHGTAAEYGWRTGNGATFSHAEPYSAKDWWPCKQSLKDKIDSADIWVTVPKGRKAGSNGVLIDSAVIDATHIRYKWKLQSPVDYYLLSVVVSDYKEYSYNLHFENSTDSMLVKNYLIPGEYTASALAALDSVGYAINYFSSLFGRYPFWEEKYGHCQVPNYGGAMENQTMTTTGFVRTDILSHELGHQWFGDNVTCATWSDIWLNEGIASYCEYLYHAHFEGAAPALAYMKKEQQTAILYDSGTVYVYDTTNRSRIFSSRLTYDKGSVVMHMLRFVFNNDELFFDMLKEYQQRFKHSNANTENFKHIAEEFYGGDLAYFFEQWIYKEGFPKYDVQWNQVGNLVYLKLLQEGAVPGSVPFFKTPVEVKLYSQNGDTVIRFDNDMPEQQYRVICAKQVDSIGFDPNSRLLYKLKSTPSKVPELNMLTDDIQLYPNPLKDVLNISGMKLNDTYFTLSGADGKTVMNTALRVPVGVNQIDLRGLATGTYLYNIVQGKTVRLKGKIIKQP